MGCYFIMRDQHRSFYSRRAYAVVISALLAFTPSASRSDDGGDGVTSANAVSYEDALTEWRKTLKELFRLKAAQVTSDLVARPELPKLWLAANDAHFRALDKVRVTGAAKYASASPPSAELEDFLLILMRHDLHNGRYESAYQLGKRLRDAGCQVTGLEYQFGMAAFATNRYTEAKTSLELSAQYGTTQDQGLVFLQVVDQYITFWKEEKAIREKEAAADDLPRVVLHTTEGDIVLELFENEAPETVGNFINLVEKGFYDDRSFFRVTRGFLAQTGCPKDNGEGGPGYSISCECFKPNYRKHFGGTIAMAKGSRNEQAVRDSAGSQFFINFQPGPHLNGEYTVFGRVIEGMDVVSRLQPQGEEEEEESEELVRPDRIMSTKVLRKRSHEYVPHIAH